MHYGSNTRYKHSLSWTQRRFLCHADFGATCTLYTKGVCPNNVSNLKRTTTKRLSISLSLRHFLPWKRHFICIYHWATLRYFFFFKKKKLSVVRNIHVWLYSWSQCWMGLFLYYISTWWRQVLFHDEPYLTKKQKRRWVRKADICTVPFVCIEKGKQGLTFVRHAWSTV